MNSGDVIYKEFNEESHCYDYVMLKADEYVLQAHEILLKVKACALSADCSPEILTELFLKKPRVRLSAANSVAGIVMKTGALVTRCAVGDRVGGLLPLDAESSGCAHFCCLTEFDLVKLPDTVDFEPAACCLGDGLRAYIALHYLGRVSPGETVLIMDAASTFGSLAVQLAHMRAAKVLAVITNDQDRSYLQKLQPPPEHIIEIDSKTTTTALYSSVMEETGRLGVDVFIDNGVRQFPSEDEHRNLVATTAMPIKHEVVSCLAVGARWVTSCPSLQLDPPNSMQLFLRGATVGFLFEHSWNLSSAHQGRLLHVMSDLVNRLADGSLTPQISQVIPFCDAVNVLQKIDKFRLGKVIVRVDNDN